MHKSFKFAVSKPILEKEQASRICVGKIKTI